MAEVKVTKRGTSNGNSAGSAEDRRRRRRKWLLETYRADVDACPYCTINPHDVPLGTGIPACRCYRCGKLLTIETLTVDRIIPGCQGGTYKRTNIRPACSTCNSETGGKTRARSTRKRVPVVRPNVRGVATRDAQADSGSQGPVSVPDVRPSGEGDIRLNGSVAR